MKDSRLRKPLLIGIALLLLTNAVVLGGVYYNRAGDDVRRITLTERELTLPYRYGRNRENSGIALRLNYRVASGRAHKYYLSGSGSPAWFDRKKLALVGYDVSPSVDSEQGRRAYKKLRSREALLVLEYDGATYQAALDHAQKGLLEKRQQLDRDPHSDIYQNQLKNAERMLEREQTRNSRLFVIDVGNDEQSLRKQYADSARYIIVAGKVGISLHVVKGGVWELSGNIHSVAIREVTVPWKYRSLFEGILDRPRSSRVLQQAPRYQLSVAYGKRLEPWIIDAVSLPSAQ